MSNDLRTAVDRVVTWAGRPPVDDLAFDRLLAYHDWLEGEAIAAGGLGPREGPRIWGRHILDSLTFAVAWHDADPPGEILDVGTGVGLPGIPLAIIFPDTMVRLLDRGGRRIRLMQRATRILELPNAATEQADVFTVADEWEGMTFRGSVKAPEAVGLASRLLTLGGRAALGLSRRPTPPDETRNLVGIGTAMGLDVDTVEVPEGMLDGPAWLLIMRS